MSTQVGASPPSVALRLQRWRVPLGFAFGAVFLFFSRPTLEWLIPGLLVAGAGLLLRGWAAGHLKKHEHLTISGPYRWTRNPLYLGSFLMGLGFSMASGRWWMATVFLVLFLAVYLPVMQAEEGELRSRYGAPADTFIERVSLFAPLKPPVARNESHQFTWEQFMKNREYRAVIGFLLVASFLALRLALQ